MPPPGHVIDGGKKGRDGEPEDWDGYLDEEQAQPVGIKPRLISITVGDVETTARLDPTPTAQQLWHVLPLTGTTKVWGEEVYFKVPFTCPPEDLREEVEPGEIGYWPEGDCVCIFHGDRANSPVDVFGSVDCDPALFRDIVEGQEIRLERSE